MDVLYYQMTLKMLWFEPLLVKSTSRSTAKTLIHFFLLFLNEIEYKGHTKKMKLTRKKVELFVHLNIESISVVKEFQLFGVMGTNVVVVNEVVLHFSN